MTSRKFAVLGICVFLGLCVVAGLFLYHPWKTASPPLGEGPLIEYPSDKRAQSEIQQFFVGNFLIIKDVNNLPPPVLWAFTEQHGSRVVMANPGKKFRATDVVVDPTLPYRRLIFAGVSGDRCFVHYEQGGLAHSYLVALFQVTSKDNMKPIWRGYCWEPATSFEELRSWLLDGKCSGR